MRRQDYLCNVKLSLEIRPDNFIYVILVMENYGPAYNFNKNLRPRATPSVRPDYVKAYAKIVKSLCAKGMSREDAEKQANAQVGSVKDWVSSEHMLAYNGNIYAGSPPVSSSPRLTNSNRKSRRLKRRKSRKSRKT